MIASDLSRHPYRYETHLHTSESSRCASSSGAEMARACAQAGYHGIIVTDHFFNGHCAVPVEVPWPERVDAFCAGYRSARRVGEQLGISVFFGWEYNYQGTEFLTYGLGEEFLLDNPDLLDWDVTTYLDRARTAGAMISQAHPYRRRPNIDCIRIFDHHVDALEVVNAHLDERYNHLAQVFVETCNHLAFTGGSDHHDTTCTKKSGMVFPYRLDSIADFNRAVIERQGLVIARDV